MTAPRVRPRWSMATKAFVSACMLALFVYLVARFSIVIAPLMLAAPTIASARILGRFFFANLLDLDPFGEESPAEVPDVSSIAS